MTPVDPHVWPPSPHWAVYAMRVRLEALCRIHACKQGWVPVRMIRRVIGT